LSARPPIANRTSHERCLPRVKKRGKKPEAMAV
jgi:hypothetical protein